MTFSLTPEELEYFMQICRKYTNDPLEDIWQHMAEVFEWTKGEPNVKVKKETTSQIVQAAKDFPSNYTIQDIVDCMTNRFD